MLDPMMPGSTSMAIDDTTAQKKAMNQNVVGRRNTAGIVGGLLGAATGNPLVAATGVVGGALLGQKKAKANNAANPAPAKAPTKAQAVAHGLAASGGSTQNPAVTGAKMGAKPAAAPTAKTFDKSPDDRTYVSKSDKTKYIDAPGKTTKAANVKQPTGKDKAKANKLFTGNG